MVILTRSTHKQHFRANIRKIMYTPINPCFAILASLRENRSSGFPTRSDTSQAVQPQKMARGLKFRI